MYALLFFGFIAILPAQSTNLFWTIFVFLWRGLNFLVDVLLCFNCFRNLWINYLIFCNFINNFSLINIIGILHFFRYLLLICKVNIFLFWEFTWYIWNFLGDSDTLWFLRNITLDLFLFLFVHIIFLDCTNSLCNRLLILSASRIFLGISWPTQKNYFLGPLLFPLGVIRPKIKHQYSQTLFCL